MKKILTFLLLSIFVISLSACTSDEVKLELIGDENVQYTVNQAYSEKGFMAHSGSSDISENVTITNNIDESKPGDYSVTYTLEFEEETYTLTRNVFYRDTNCQKVLDTNLTECRVSYTEYLHTYIQLNFYYEDDTYHGKINEIVLPVQYILEAYHQLSNKYDAFDGVVNVKTINDSPAETHVIDEKLYDLIDYSLTHQADVDNRFNIALGPVLSIWHDYRDACNISTNGSNCFLPTITELEAANAYTDFTKIVLNPDDLSITMEDNMSIDLGGVSKGYISGVITDFLDSLELHGYLLNNGESNISIGGEHPVRESGKFLLAVTDPTFTMNYYATLYISDGDQLVTSGDYQQYYVVDGVEYHHIISPDTLFPENYARSVSVITDDPGLADLYSTAIFTMSIEDGIELVDSIDNLEGIWYGTDDKVYFSENFEELYEVTLQ